MDTGIRRVLCYPFLFLQMASIRQVKTVGDVDNQRASGDRKARVVDRMMDPGFSISLTGSGRQVCIMESYRL